MVSVADSIFLNGRRSEDSRPWAARGSAEGLTLPQLLELRAESQSQSPAVRAIERGALVTYSWSRLHEAAASLAGAFVALGLDLGARAILVGPTRWPLIVAEHAVWRAGGVAVAVSHHLDPDEFISVARTIDPSLFVVDIHGISPDLRVRLSHIVGQTSAIGVAIDTDPARNMPSGFLALTDLDVPESAAPDIPSDPRAAAAIVFSSGRIRTARPIVHSHASLIAAALETRAAIPTVPTNAVLVCAIPSAHYLGKLANLTLPLVSDLVPHLPERPDLELEAIRRLAPHVLLGPPRFFEKLAARVEGGLDRSGRVRRRIIGRTGADNRGFSSRLARVIMFRPLLRRLGFHRLRFALVGGAPVDDRAITIWRCWGVGLRRFYSLAELGGPIVFESEVRGVFRSAPTQAAATLAVDSHDRLLLEGEIPSLGTWSNGTIESWSSEPLVTGDIASITDQGLRLVGRTDDTVVCPKFGINVTELAAKVEQLEAVDKVLVHCQAGSPEAVILLLTSGGGHQPSAALAGGRLAVDSDGGERVPTLRAEVATLIERFQVDSPEVVLLDRPLDPLRGELTLLGEPRVTVVLEHTRELFGHESDVRDAAVEASENA